MTQAPATPELVDDWALEIAACGFANDSTLPDSVRSFIKDLWRAYCEIEQQAADALEAQQARIAELEVENERLRLTMLGGEDVAGFASSLPLAQVLDSFRTYETALRDSANSAQALVDRYEKALAYIAENDRSYLVAPTPGAKGYPGHYGHVARQALSSSQGRHEGGEEPAGVYRGWKGVTQPCDVCGKSVAVNAVSPSECHCSEACGLIAYGLDKPSPDNTNPKAGAPEHGV